MNENKKLLYDYFEKYYNNNIFASNVKSILHNHNLRLNSLIFINEIDYIKHFGYNKIKRIGSGAFGITYLCHKAHHAAKGSPGFPRVPRVPQGSRAPQGSPGPSRSFQEAPPGCTRLHEAPRG